MKATVIAAALALFAVACGGAVAEAAPTVDISRLDANGATAILEFTVEGGSTPMTVVIDWGDQSPVETLQGPVSSAASHDYAAGVTEVVVTVMATDADGRQARVGRALTLVAESTTTSSSTSTSTISTTTSSSSTTSSTSTTTTPTTTSTTLPPEALQQVIELRLQDADFVEERITPQGANGNAEPAGGAVDLEAVTAGLDGDVFAESRIGWEIPESVWSQLGPEPQLSVIMDYEYSVVLDTGPNPGRAAAFDLFIAAHMGTDALGIGRVAGVAIEANDSEDLSGDERTGFGSLLPANARGPISIVLVSSCSVSSGSNIFQVGESSTCEGSVRPMIRATLTRADDA